MILSTSRSGAIQAYVTPFSCCGRARFVTQAIRVNGFNTLSFASWPQRNTLCRQPAAPGFHLPMKKYLRFAAATAVWLSHLILHADLNRADEPVEFPVPATVKLHADLQYREGSPAWRLDLAVPAAPSAKPLPVIINVHGGGWSAGDKNGGRHSIVHWAQRGYAGVTVRYRLLGEAPFPACIEDVKCAVRWLRAHAKEYNLDPRHIGAFGHSAGAHLVAMLGLCPDDAGFDLGPWAGQSSVVNAVCSIATPTDLANGRELRRFPGATEEERLALARKCSPLTYASAGAPPFLLIHGTIDRTVPINEAQTLAGALREKGAGQVNLVILDGLGHDPMLTHEIILRPLADAFFDSTIGSQAGALDTQTRLARRFQTERNSPEGFGFNQVAVFDRNRDSRITRDEWPGSEEMLARIDRGRNFAIEPEEMTGGRTSRPPAPAGRTP